MSEEDTGTRGEHSQAESDKVIATIERVVLTESEKDSLSKEEWAQKWLTMESFVDQLEERMASMEGSKPVSWCFLYKSASVLLLFCLFILKFSKQYHITCKIYQNEKG